MPFAGAFEHDVDEAWRAGVRRRAGAGGAAAARRRGGERGGDGAVARRGRRRRRAPPDRGCSTATCAARATARDADPAGRQRRAAGVPRAGCAADCPDAAGFWPAQAVANHALCGRGAIDSTTAMTAHPLFDFVGWDAALAAAAGASPAQLPDVVRGAEPVGAVDGGLPAAGALVGGGTIDALAEQLVAGRRRRRRRARHLRHHADHVGGGRRVGRGARALDDPAHGAGHVAGRRAVSNAGGLFLDWVRRLARRPDRGGRRRRRPGDVPVWLPYVRGERTPLHRPDLRASLHGLSLHHGPATCCGPPTRRPASSCATTSTSAPAPGSRRRRIVATGGGTRSSLGAGAGRRHRAAGRRRRRARGRRPRRRLHRPLHRRPRGRT